MRATSPARRSRLADQVGEADAPRDASTSRSMTSAANVSSWPIDFVAARVRPAGRRGSTPACADARRAASPSVPTRVSTGTRRDRRRSCTPSGRAGGGRRTDAPEPSHRERVQELELGRRVDHQQPVGLAEVARELGELLRGGDTDRGDEPVSPRTRARIARRDRPARAVAPPHAAHVEERLVERQRLHERRDDAEDRHDRRARGVVGVEARGRNVASGQRRSAPTIGIAECTPNDRAS